MPSRPARITRLVRLERLSDCLQWVLPHYQIDRASWIINRLTAQVHIGGAHDILAVATFTDTPNDFGVDPFGDTNCEPGVSNPVDCAGEIVGVAIAVTQPGRAATLLAIHVTGEATPEELLLPLLQKLASRGVIFIQASSETAAQASLLATGGFEWLTDLVLMSLQSDQFDVIHHHSGHPDSGHHGRLAHDPELVTWVGLDELGEDWRSHLSRIAGRTFIDTQDCPRLNQFRTAEDIVHGYTEAPHFERRLGSLLRIGDDWGGCLIMTAHRPPGALETGIALETGTVSGLTDVHTMEIAYMGVVPEFRGQGFAAHLLRRAIGQAKTVRASQIVLAVDRENRPAIAIYRRYGWRDVVGETVWGRKI
jgi:ribosomal protein S18 acetylase RimI-like enzyme